MTKRMPEAPEANRSDKGPGERHEAPSDTMPVKQPGDLHAAEQGDTAIKQNTTNKGFFRGGRMK